MRTILFGGATLVVGAVVAWSVARGAVAPRAEAGPGTAADPPGSTGSPRSAGPAGDAATVRFFRDPKTVPAFDVTTIDGRRVTAGRGRVTIVNFWATWCGPCRAEIPMLMALQAKYPDTLLIIGVSEDEEGPDVVRAFAAERKMNYPVVMSTAPIREIFPGVAALPTSFILDRDGRIVQKHVGLTTARDLELEALALAGADQTIRVELVDPPKPAGLENAAQAREIPGVDLASLSPAKRAEALKRLNSEGCTCGCELTVARCRVEDPSCGISLPVARKIVAALAPEKP
jgi:thiol-disulfide isomerase/thioredoxin